MAATVGKSLYSVTTSSTKTMSGRASQSLHGTTSSSVMTLTRKLEASSVEKICEEHIYDDVYEGSTPHHVKEKPL